MIKIIKKNFGLEPITKKMCYMEPLEVGVIHKSDSRYNGDIVMRTASCNHFEVIHIVKNMKYDNCWTNPEISTLPVRMLMPNESVTLLLSNE